MSKSTKSGEDRAKIPKTLTELELLLKQGEGSSLEFKRSTGELREGLQTACAFLNGEGGLVVFGAKPDGRLEGQQVTDQTLREIAQGMDRFEPSAKLPMRRIKVKRGLEAVLLEVPAVLGKAPFSYDGRAFERFESVTKRMSQVRYETLLVNRAHAQHRWENAPAPGVKIARLDGQEILRVRDLAIQQNRISPGTGRNKVEILERMGLLTNGVPTHAAQVLFGGPSVADYPQALLKLGRFRGSKITGEIVDNRQEYYNNFPASTRRSGGILLLQKPSTARAPLRFGGGVPIG
jgi:ATP-dependent DNA helicase RecG